MSQLQTRRTHTVIDASRRQPVKRLNQKELDTSCFRLSRVAQKYKSNRAVKQEEQRSFIDKYYSENPDALDIRSPDEKLEEIENQLQDENLEPHDKFLLIAQQKQLSSFKYGEESSQVMRCEIQLGVYYNEIGRPKSAIRHLTKAHQLENPKETTPEESVIIAVETTDAYLSIQDSLKRNEAIKNLNRASELLKAVANVPLEDQQLTYRRDIDIPRVSANRGKFNEALEQYETAMKSLEACFGKDSAEAAGVLCEMGETASYAGDIEKSKDLYFSAFQIYRALDMNAQAEAILPKFKTEEEEEKEKEEEEEKPKEEEEAVLEQTLDNVINKTLTNDNQNENETEKDETNQNEVKQDETNQFEVKQDEPKLNDVLKDALSKDDAKEEKHENDLEISDDFLDGTMKSSQKEDNDQSNEDKSLVEANEEGKSEEAKNEEPKNEDGSGKAESIITGLGGALIG